MSIYIHKNNQQSGPFEEAKVLEWLKNGQLSNEDLACREGASDWQPLRILFPQTSQVSTPNFPSANVQSRMAEETPSYRKTTFQKIVFGGIFVLLILAFVASLVYFKNMMGSSGDLEADLRNMSYRILARNTAIALFIAAFFGLIAFLLTFKKKIISSGGLRIILRCCFVFLLVIGIIQIGYASFSYLNYRPPYKPPVSKNSESNSLLKAMDEGEAATGGIAIPAFHTPIALGLLLLGAAGFSMTQPGREKLKPT